MSGASKERLARDLAETQRQTRLWMQSTLEKFPDPLLILGCSSNIVAFQFDLLKLFGVGPQKTCAGCISWLHVRWLQDQGAALERSLQTPYADVVV